MSYVESAETVVIAKLDELQRQLAEKEAKRARADAEAMRRAEAEVQGGANSALAARMPSAARVKRDREIGVLQIQVQLLEELKEKFEHQRTQMEADFTSIKERDERSSKQNFWLTIVSSAISLIVGWLLSLAGSPSLLLSLAHR